MEISELLEKHRNQYVNFFTEMSQSCDGANEILLDQKIDEPEELYRLYRFDCLEKNEDGGHKILEYNNDTYLNHSSISFILNDMEIELNPIYWNGVEIDVFGFNNNWEPIKEWIVKWIDSEERNEIEPTGNLSGLIHNFQRPEVFSDKSSLAIDFGTAKVSSIIELIKVFSENKTSGLRIHSDSLIKD